MALLILAIKAHNLNSILVEGNHFVDEHGRYRVFHGTNSVYKAFPWFHEDLLTGTESLEKM